MSLDDVLKDRYKDLQKNDPYPNGKIDVNDMGAIPVAIRIEGDIVAIRMPKPVDFLGLDPETALKLGEGICSAARFIAKKNIIKEAEND